MSFLHRAPSPPGCGSRVIAGEGSADPVLVHRLQRYSETAAAASVAVGILVLCGWAFHVARLTSIAPGLASMKPNTAAGLTMVGLSLGAAARAERRAISAPLVQGLTAGLAATLGFATLMEYFLGRDLGIDQVLFRAPAAPSLSAPGRMAPTTATCFVLLGAALLAAGRRRYRASAPLSAMVAVIGLVAAIGYLYGVSALYRISAFTSMAPHTALAFIAAALGTMALGPERRVIASRSAGGTLLRRLLPAAVLGVIGLGWARLAGQRAGLYGTEFGLGVMVASQVVVSVGLLLRTARLLQEVDVGRLAAERDVLSLNRDLEDRVRRRTHELSASERRTAAIIAASADAFVAADAGGRITDWNRQAELTFGWSRDEVLGRSLSETVVPERFRVAHEELVRRFLDAGNEPVPSQRAELVAVDRRGHEFPIEMAASVSALGSAPSFNAFVKDISERTEAERQLRQSEERFRVLAESAPVGIYRTDPHGRCVYTNPAWTAIMGLSAEETMTGGAARAFVEEDRDRVYSAWAHATATGEDYAQRFRVRRPDGAVRWIDSRAVAFSGSESGGGADGGFIGTVTDVSAQVEADIALAAARDLAVEASRLKSDFLATMSHEIRTPMNGVIGLTGLLLDSELTGTQRHHAEGVRASGEALLGIINDILDFSKIEAGKLELEIVDFDLGQAVEDVAALVAQSAASKGLELVAYCAPGVPTDLRGDVSRLRQILLNFATNAVKFTSRGEVVVRVSRAWPAPDGRVFVRFEVTDTGPGIDPAKAPGLFDPFAQADVSTTRRYGGTGLGLAICRRLAQAMDGAVGVDSQPGVGSTFWLDVPLGRSLVPVVRRPSDGSLGQARALIVDDNATNRMVLAAQLQGWGLTADLAVDADDALARVQAAAQPYDVALIDIAMPGMDGLELARALRSHPDPRVRAVRMLLLSSAYVDEAAAADAGFEASLTKPVRVSKLYDTLRLVTAKSATRPGPARPAPAGVPPRSRGTLLIVEDNAINQEVARGIAAKLGFGSDVAGDGVEALAAIERRAYDAVLMDCNMPEMDGFEATAELRRREAGQGHLPVIAMTAGAMVEDREKCLAAGMDDFVSKPVTDHQLQTVLARWVPAGRPVPGASHVSSTPAEPDDGLLDVVQFDSVRDLALADTSLLPRLVAQFDEDARSQIATLRDAAGRGDIAALASAAHALRGMSATMGASGLTAACEAIELDAARGQLPTVERRAHLQDQLDRTTEVMRAHLGRTPADR